MAVPPGVGSHQFSGHEKWPRWGCRLRMNCCCCNHLLLQRCCFLHGEALRRPTTLPLCPCRCRHGHAAAPGGRAARRAGHAAGGPDCAGERAQPGLCSTIRHDGPPCVELGCLCSAHQHRRVSGGWPGPTSAASFRLPSCYAPPCDHCPVLCLQLEVMPSPVFRREDFDLYVDAPIDMVDAALGTTIE